MQNINTNTQDQCKDNKKQAAKCEIIKNPKNNTPKTNTNDNGKICEYSYSTKKNHKYI